MLDCDNDTRKFIQDCINYYTEWHDKDNIPDLSLYALGKKLYEHEKEHAAFMAEAIDYD